MDISKYLGKMCIPLTLNLFNPLNGVYKSCTISSTNLDPLILDTTIHSPWHGVNWKHYRGVHSTVVTVNCPFLYLQDVQTYYTTPVCLNGVNLRVHAWSWHSGHVTHRVGTAWRQTNILFDPPSQILNPVNTEVRISRNLVKKKG